MSNYGYDRPRYIPEGGWTVSPEVRHSLVEGLWRAKLAARLPESSAITERSLDMFVLSAVMVGDTQRVGDHEELHPDSVTHLKKMAALKYLEDTSSSTMRSDFYQDLYREVEVLTREEITDFLAHEKEDEDDEELPGPWQDAIEDLELFQSHKL